MKITQIYKQYKIMPMLREHLFRVAAVARLIAVNFKEELDVDNITKACLLHDMGNIIKFKLGALPEALEPEGLEYWQEVKDKYHQKKVQ